VLSSPGELGQGGQQGRNGGVVAEGGADVPVAVLIARPENKRAAELERVSSQLVLAMTGLTRPLACGRVIAANEMQQVRRAQPRGAIRLAVCVDQQRKGDPGLIAEGARVVYVAETDRGEACALCLDLLLMLAQLRDVLAAEQSSVVTQKRYYRGSVGPERAEPDLIAVTIG
jgi:hypothetical protein